MHIFFKIFVYFFCLCLLFGCTIPQAYRYLDSYSYQKSCPAYFNSFKNNNELYENGKNTRCSVQIHRIPGKDDSFLTENTYKLAFVEFSETTGKLADERQLTRLHNLLQTPSPKYLIVFVHGWRHDAQVGNLDVARFRILLAYSRRFLNQRSSRYENAEVIGLYIGWRGRSFREPPRGELKVQDRRRNNKNYLWTIGAAPTVWSRKNASQKHASLLLNTLDSLQKSLHLTPPGAPGDKMLIVGHSFGGNMLMLALKDRAVSSLGQHERGTPLQPISGSLAVLINPASEASNWTAIQKALRQKVGAPLDGPQRERNGLWRTEFPANQHPVFISLTATAKWSEEERGNTPANAINFDSATANLFPKAYFLRANPQNRITVGHLLPDYSPDEPYPQNSPFGASYELVTNKGGGFPTEMESTRLAEKTVCDLSDGWLFDARNRSDSVDTWDSGYTYESGRPGSPPNLTSVDRAHGVEIQFRRGLSLPGRGTGTLKPVVPLNSPFWNVRAFHTAIQEHGGYVNYPTWCAINQMVLDDITRRKSAGH